jgi:hypothetical protein
MQQRHLQSTEACKMKRSLFLAGFLSAFLFNGQHDTAPGRPLKKIEASQIEAENRPANNFSALINPDGMTIESRIRTPQGFDRVGVAEDSFAHYLRRLPLKPHQAKVLLYNGSIKENHGVYDAVVDLKIGKKNLHQCADAVIRLRAEYLYQRKQFAKIHFNFTNGFRADYADWMKGKRVVAQGNKTYWKQTHGPAKTYQDFWDYLEVVFSYAGTLSLAKELESANIDDLQIGDVFIQGGSPGHAIIVVDLAINPPRNKKIFLLAQSYMPAQEIQILKNPNNQALSPWYSTDFNDALKTPEWDFYKTHRKRFAER